MTSQRNFLLGISLLALVACGKGSLRVNTADMTSDPAAAAKKRAKQSAEKAAKDAAGKLAVGADDGDDDDDADEDDDAPKAKAKRKGGKKPALPTACAKSSEAGACLPDAAFVEALCDGEEPKPGAALVLFAKGSPWTRAYAAHAVEAVYVSGDETKKSQLAVGEELVVLRRPKTKGSATAPYEVLRWDGACLTLGADEVTTKKPASPKRAAVVWSTLPEDVREKLSEDAGVAKAWKARQAACRGVSDSTPPPPACAKAEQALSAKVVEWTLAGGKAPAPDFVAE